MTFIDGAVALQRVRSTVRELAATSREAMPELDAIPGLMSNQVASDVVLRPNALPRAQNYLTLVGDNSARIREFADAWNDPTLTFLAEAADVRARELGQNVAGRMEAAAGPAGAWFERVGRDPKFNVSQLGGLVRGIELVASSSDRVTETAIARASAATAIEAIRGVATTEGPAAAVRAGAAAAAKAIEQSRLAIAKLGEDSVVVGTPTQFVKRGVTVAPVDAERIVTGALDHAGAGAQILREAASIATNGKLTGLAAHTDATLAMVDARVAALDRARGELAIWIARRGDAHIEPARFAVQGEGTSSFTAGRESYQSVAGISRLLGSDQSLSKIKGTYDQISVLHPMIDASSVTERRHGFLNLRTEYTHDVSGAATRQYGDAEKSLLELRQAADDELFGSAALDRAPGALADLRSRSQRAVEQAVTPGELRAQLADLVVEQAQIAPVPGASVV